MNIGAAINPSFPDPAAGASDDWALGVAKVPLSYTLELRDEGAAGFVLPPHQIVPAVRAMVFLEPASKWMGIFRYCPATNLCSDINMR